MRLQVNILNSTQVAFSFTHSLSLGLSAKLVSQHQAIFDVQRPELRFQLLWTRRHLLFACRFLYRQSNLLAFLCVLCDAYDVYFCVGTNLFYSFTLSLIKAHSHVWCFDHPASVRYQEPPEKAWISCLLVFLGNTKHTVQIKKLLIKCSRLAFRQQTFLVQAM